MWKGGDSSHIRACSMSNRAGTSARGGKREVCGNDQLTKASAAKPSVASRRPARRQAEQILRVVGFPVVEWSGVEWRAGMGMGQADKIGIEFKAEKGRLAGDATAPTLRRSRNQDPGGGNCFCSVWTRPAPSLGRRLKRCSGRCWLLFRGCTV